LISLAFSQQAEQFQTNCLPFEEFL